MRVGFKACTDSVAVDLCAENDVAEIGAGGDGVGEGVMVCSGTLRGVDLAEKLERIRVTL